VLDFSFKSWEFYTLLILFNIIFIFILKIFDTSKIKQKLEATAGDNIPSEYSYWKNGKMVGYCAYGYFDPAMPYQGKEPKGKEEK
jgi:hypothetical protein